MQPHSATHRLRPFARANGNENPDVWQSPEPLVAQHETSPYPVDALPELTRQAVEEVQTFVQAPVELVAASALTALSIAGQQLADVRRDNGLCGPVSLFLLSVAESGERKSSVDGHFMQPIRERERVSREASTGEIANHAAAMTAWEANREAAAGKLKRAATDGKDLNAPTADLANVEGGKPTPPRVPRWLYADCTYEKLTRNLASNWPAAAIVSSEGGAVLGGHSLGKDSAMRTMSAINELWSGSPLTIDRQ